MKLSHITFAWKLHHSQFTDLNGYMKHNGKGMWFECEQLFLSGKCCVTFRKTAAKQTSNQLELKQKPLASSSHKFSRAALVYFLQVFTCVLDCLLVRDSPLIRFYRL